MVNCNLVSWSGGFSLHNMIFFSGYIPSVLAYKPVAIQPLHHRLAADVLQGNLAQACIAVQELQIRGKGLKWLKDFKESIVKEITSLWQQESGHGKCQDRELKEFKMGGFEDSVSQDEEVVVVIDPEERKLRKVLKVGGIKLPGLGTPRGRGTH